MSLSHFLVSRRWKRAKRAATRSARLVAAERVRELYRQVAPVLAANVSVGILLGVALWPQVEAATLVGWAAALTILCILRTALWFAYLGQRRPDEEMALWGRVYTVGSACSGALWGVTALLFIVPGDPVSTLVVAFVIGGMAAGAVVGLGSHLPAFYAFLALNLLPLEGRLLACGDRQCLAMAGMTAVFAASMGMVGRNYNRALTHRLLLAEDKRRLIADMERQIDERTAELQQEIGERRRAEQVSAEARAQAEEANQAKSRFLAAASHDLRQPLQSLFLFSQTLRGHLKDAKGEQVLTLLERGLNVLKDLLDSLLDVSRLDVNVIEPELARVPLKPMLEEIASAFAPVAAAKGIEMRVGPVSDVALRTDTNLLGRMLRNLVENAVRYTPKGSVSLSARELGDRIRIEVADTGIGIPTDELDRVFEEFHQVGNARRDKAHGLGLGLAIVQRLSAILGHPVEVRSELGAGSVFSVDVPRDAATRASVRPQRAPEAALPGGGKTVVLIEDDPLVLMALREVLEDWGQTVLAAGSIDEAEEQLRQVGRQPDLILADYKLRGGATGAEAIERIRTQCGAAVPGVILTGGAGEETTAAVSGFPVLHKPVTGQQLGGLLRRVAGK
jgi:signal transduction histidine kinase